MSNSIDFEAILFDAYGTLLDLDAVTARAEECVPGQGDRLATLWRDKQLTYSRLRAVSGRYADFATVTADALDCALECLDLSLDPEVRAHLLRSYWQLPAFEDAQPALESFRQRGIRLGVLSNGTPEMLETVLHAAGLCRLLDDVISVDPARSYKTAPAAYALGPAQLCIPTDRILFVSSNHWDICGASWFGYRTYWVNRGKLPPERLGVTAHKTGRSLLDLSASTI